MKFKLVIQPHDSVWTESQRGAYLRLAERAAAGCPSFRDAHWLAEAFRTLGLTPHDFQHDVDALRSGDLSDAPRMRDEWPDVRDLDVQEMTEESDETHVA